MPSFDAGPGNVLYLIVCAAPPAAQTAELVKAKQNEGWDVCVIATDMALDWFDPEQVEALTGHEVRHQFRKPGEPSFDPLGNAVLVAPATFNTINKWALGINDSLALGLLNEALGRGVPDRGQALPQRRTRQSPGLPAGREAAHGQRRGVRGLRHAITTQVPKWSCDFRVLGKCRYACVARQSATLRSTAQLVAPEVCGTGPIAHGSVGSEGRDQKRGFVRSLQ